LPPQSPPRPRSASPSTSFTLYLTARGRSSRTSFSPPPRPTRRTPSTDVRALELDGLAHGYTADEPLIYDAAAPLLESSRLDQEPPSLVRQTQEAVRWLSTSIACLDEDTREAPAAITDTLARLLVVRVFADTACTSSE
jgi:hypothetical protein